MNKEEKKEKLKSKFFPAPEESVQYLSAQEYNVLTLLERQLFWEVVSELGYDTDEFERKMKALWPKQFQTKTLIWRHK